jgi:Zn-dependent protease with chaperone function
MSMIRALVLLGVAVVLLWPVRIGLVRARWTEVTPRAAIALWQSVGFALGIAVVGACFELAASSTSAAPPRRLVTDFTAGKVVDSYSGGMRPGELFALTAGLIVLTLVLGSLGVRAVGIARARARQRLLIDLVGSPRPELPGAVVVEHPRATAFGLPGFKGRVVLSSGAVEALADDELQAVLAHEWAHVHARHDLVLFPFRSLAASLPESRSLAAVSTRVGTLVEMAADDRALRECAPDALARALCTLSAVGDNAAEGGLPAAFRLTRRIERAFGVRRSSKVLAAGSVFAAIVITTLPVAVLLAPLPGR